jgi:hypothetical protein
MYQASVPVFQKMLGNLDHVIDKALADAASRKIAEPVLLQARLAPDMLPFTKQVQIMADFAKGTSARLAGVEIPKYEDNEATFADLKARIQKTLDFIATIKPAQVDGSEEKTIQIKAGPRDMTFRGIDYLLTYAMPNFYFHYVTAYDILRHNGVPVGKGDFIAGKM